MEELVAVEVHGVRIHLARTTRFLKLWDDLYTGVHEGVSISLFRPLSDSPFFSVGDVGVHGHVTEPVGAYSYLVQQKAFIEPGMDFCGIFMACN